MKPLVYVLEDEPAIRKLIVYALENDDYAAHGVGDGGALFAACEKTPPALLILDLMLGSEDGLEVLARFRKKEAWRSVPVIIVSALGEEFDKVRGLDAGADDYLAKPFGMMELLARVRALLRRATAGAAPCYEHGRLLLKADERRVSVAGRAVPLTRKEYELLLLFLEHPRKAFRREELLARVWGYDSAMETRTLDAHIRSLRQKLGADVIETVRGVGYRLAPLPDATP